MSEAPAHDWQWLGPYCPRNVYETKRKYYRCKNCGIRAGTVYASHRLGWVESKNFEKPCKASNEQFTLFWGGE